LGEKGFDEVFGARPLKRAIQDMIVDKLSEAILRGEFLKKDTILVDVRDVTDDKGVTEKQDFHGKGARCRDGEQQLVC